MEVDNVEFVIRKFKVNVYNFDTIDSILDRAEALNNIPEGFLFVKETNIEPYKDYDDVPFIEIHDFYDVIENDPSILNDVADPNSFLSTSILKRWEVNSAESLAVIIRTIINTYNEESESSSSSPSYDNIANFIKINDNAVKVIEKIRKIPSLDITAIRETFDLVRKRLLSYISKIHIYTNNKNTINSNVFREKSMDMILKSIGKLFTTTNSQVKVDEPFTLNHVEYAVDVNYPVGTRLLEIFDAMNVNDQIPYAKLVYQRKSYHKIRNDPIPVEMVRQDFYGEQDSIYFTASITSETSSDENIESIKPVYRKCKILRDEYQTIFYFHVNPSIVPFSGIDPTPELIRNAMYKLFGQRLLSEIQEPYQNGIKGCMVYRNILFNPTLFSYMISSSPAISYMFFVRDFGNGVTSSGTLSKKGMRKESSEDDSGKTHYTLYYTPNHRYSLKVAHTRISIGYNSTKYPYEISVDIRSDMNKKQMNDFLILFEHILNYYSSKFEKYRDLPYLSSFIAEKRNFNTLSNSSSLKSSSKRKSQKSGEKLVRLQTERPHLFGGIKEGMTCKGTSKLESGQFFSLKCQASKNRQPWILLSRDELNAFLENNLTDPDDKNPKSVQKQILFYKYVLPYPKNGREPVPNYLAYNNTAYDEIFDWYICPLHSNKNVVFATQAQSVPVINKESFPTNTIRNTDPGAFPKTFPCCFVDKPRNRQYAKAEPQIFTTRKELDQFLNSHTKTDSDKNELFKSRIVVLPKKESFRKDLRELRYNDTKYDKNVTWFVFPENKNANTVFQSSSSIRRSMNRSGLSQSQRTATEYMLNEKKFLGEGVEGHILENMSKIFMTFLKSNEIKHPGTNKTRKKGAFTSFYRRGLELSASSFFDVVYRCLLEHPSLLVFSQYVKDSLTDKVLNRAKQSIQDKSLIELKRECDDLNTYKNPLIWAPILEGIFEINIFMFKLSSDTPEGDIVIPRYNSFYMSNDLWYKKSIIVILDYSDTTHFPYQCEMVLDRSLELHNQPVAVFDMKNDMHKRLNECLIRYFILRCRHETLGIEEINTDIDKTPKRLKVKETVRVQPLSEREHLSITSDDDEQNVSDQTIPDKYFEDLNPDEINMDGLDMLLDIFEDDDIVVVSDTNNHISKINITERLVSGGWLDDSVLNHALQEILKFSGQNSIVVANSLNAGNTTYVEKLIKRHNNQNDRLSIGDLKRLLGMSTVSSNEVRKILIPVNVGGVHWILFVITKDNNKVILNMYDSLEKPNAGIVNLYKKLLRILFRGKEIEYVNRAKDIPKQGDGVNCGVFVILYANNIINNIPFPKKYGNLTEIRWRIAVNLLNHKFPLS